MFMLLTLVIMAMEISEGKSESQQTNSFTVQPSKRTKHFEVEICLTYKCYRGFKLWDVCVTNYFHFMALEDNTVLQDMLGTFTE